MRHLKIILIVLSFVLIFLFSIHTLTSINQDIGRHLKTGQIIWETKSVPKINLFSFTEPDQPFINHHWLSEVIFYVLSIWIGLKGLIIFKAIVILLAFALIFASVYSKTGLWPLFIGLMASLPILIDRTDVRPEIFSFLFLAYFIYAILKSKHSDEHRYLYALPIIQLFWVNMHIYFALGPGLLFLYIIDRVIHERGNRPQLRIISIIFGLSCLATLFNPNFIRGALEPFMIMRNYGYSIVENQSIFFLKDWGILKMSINFFELSLLLLISSFIIAIKNGAKKISFEVLSCIALSILAIRMVRNFGPYTFIFLPVFSLNLSYSQIAPFLHKKKTQIIILILSIFLTVWLIFSVVNNSYFHFMMMARSFGLNIPNGASKAIDFVNKNNLKGPVFNNFDVGSYLIWKLYPKEKVFVDGRPEAYSYDFLKKIYIPMQEKPELWEKYSEQYKINYVFFDHQDITNWGVDFIKYIVTNPKWPLIYADDSIAIFIKRTPQNQELINKFEIITR